MLYGCWYCCEYCVLRAGHFLASGFTLYYIPVHVCSTTRCILDLSFHMTSRALCFTSARRDRVSESDVISHTLLDIRHMSQSADDQGSSMTLRL